MKTSAIAIRAPNWIGDSVMCLPAIRALKALRPRTRLVLVAKEYLADLFCHIPEIDEIVPIPNRLNLRATLQTARRLRRLQFAEGLLFTNSFHSALLFRMAGIRRLCGYARDGRSLLLQQKIRVVEEGLHHQHYYLRLVETCLHMRSEIVYPALLKVSEQEKNRGRFLIEEMGIAAARPLVAVAPAVAYGPAKAWPADRFRRLIQEIRRSWPSAAILILGSAAEARKTEAVAAGLEGNVHNLAGRLPLRDAIILLSFCHLAVTNDSGLMHLAAGLEVPLVALFGPTRPEKTAPLSRRYIRLYHPADCAPCLHRECPLDHRCLKAISVEEALAACRQLLEPSPPPGSRP